MRRTEEGYVRVRGGRVWYRLSGTPDRIPLVVLHGGPGLPHDYLEGLQELADERPVLFYDQLGCGRSDRPNDRSLWRIERFVDELRTVCDTLRLETFHLFGHSWGTMLAVDFALTQPEGLRSLVLSGPILNAAFYDSRRQILRQNLPANVRETLSRHEAGGTANSPEYRLAVFEYNNRHFCRLDPWPDCLMRAYASAGKDVVETMLGTNDFLMTGNLREYDVFNRTHEITVPTLLTCGRFDEVHPDDLAYFERLLPHSESVVFESSSHVPHLEEPELYFGVLRNFLRRAD